jgi:ABC transporter, phosphonate, periplasmic substrate-binding protein
MFQSPFVPTSRREHGAGRVMWRGFWVGAAALWLGLASRSPGQIPVLAETAPPPLKVGYLAELPVSWRTGMADPLHSIARVLGTAFAPPFDPEYPLPVDNLSGAASWEELARLIRLGSAEGGAELFPMQGYELIQQGMELNLKPLLIASRNGTSLTHFIILISKTSGIQNLRDLESRKILVHRDGCGNLVDFWLDSAIAVGTGKQRKGFARFQTVTQPREAVLPVFFGEVDACVVSLASYRSVALENAAQIPQKLIQLPEAESKGLPAQIVACRGDMPLEVQRRVKETAERLTWSFGQQTGTLIPVDDAAFDHLRTLLAAPARPQVPRTLPHETIPAAAHLQSSIPATSPAQRP